MTALKVGAKSFGRDYRSRTRSLLELAGGLPDRPSASDIHDLRVNARRIQMMRKILPRQSRTTPAAKRLELTLKSVLKATSQLRDLDTLLVTLQPYKGTLPGDVLSRLVNQRSDAAARAKMASRALVDAPALDFEPPAVRGKKLSRRLKKIVRRRSRVVVGLIADVIGVESKVAELHSLRKEVKKVRYLLELADGELRELAILTKWQELLGTVHDIDVALVYLRGSSFESKGRAISQLERLRHLAYTKFINEYGADSIESLGRSSVLVGAPMLPPL